MKTLAEQVQLGPIGSSDGSLGPFANAGSGLVSITKIISTIIGVMTLAAGIWFIFQFIIGGYNWITSGGDKAKLQTARDRLTNAFIGLIVVVGGWAILALAGQFLGVDFLINDPAGLESKLTP